MSRSSIYLIPSPQSSRFKELPYKCASAWVASTNENMKFSPASEADYHTARVHYLLPISPVLDVKAIPFEDYETCVPTNKKLAEQRKCMAAVNGIWSSAFTHYVSADLSLENYLVLIQRPLGTQGLHQVFGEADNSLEAIVYAAEQIDESLLSHAIAIICLQFYVFVNDRVLNYRPDASTFAEFSEEYPPCVFLFYETYDFCKKEARFQQAWKRVKCDEHPSLSVDFAYYARILPFPEFVRLVMCVIQQDSRYTASKAVLSLEPNEYSIYQCNKNHGLFLRSRGIIGMEIPNLIPNFNAAMQRASAVTENRISGTFEVYAKPQIYYPQFSMAQYRHIQPGNTASVYYRLLPSVYCSIFFRPTYPCLHNVGAMALQRNPCVMFDLLDQLNFLVPKKYREIFRSGMNRYHEKVVQNLAVQLNLDPGTERKKQRKRAKKTSQAQPAKAVKAIGINDTDTLQLRLQLADFKTGFATYAAYELNPATKSLLDPVSLRRTFFLDPIKGFLFYPPLPFLDKHTFVDEADVLYLNSHRLICLVKTGTVLPCAILIDTEEELRKQTNMSDRYRCFFVKATIPLPDSVQVHRCNGEFAAYNIVAFPENNTQLTPFLVNMRVQLLSCILHVDEMSTQTTYELYLMLCCALRKENDILATLLSLTKFSVNEALQHLKSSRAVYMQDLNKRFIDAISLLDNSGKEYINNIISSWDRCHPLTVSLDEVYDALVDRPSTLASFLSNLVTFDQDQGVPFAQVVEFIHQCLKQKQMLPIPIAFTGLSIYLKRTNERKLFSNAAWYLIKSFENILFFPVVVYISTKCRPLRTLNETSDGSLVYWNEAVLETDLPLCVVKIDALFTRMARKLADKLSRDEIHSLESLPASGTFLSHSQRRAMEMLYQVVPDTAKELKTALQPLTVPDARACETDRTLSLAVLSCIREMQLMFVFNKPLTPEFFWDTIKFLAVDPTRLETTQEKLMDDFCFVLQRAIGDNKTYLQRLHLFMVKQKADEFIGKLIMYIKTKKRNTVLFSEVLNNNIAATSRVLSEGASSALRTVTIGNKRPRV